MQVKSNDTFLELIRNSKQRVYDFLFFMLSDKGEAEELLLSIFRNFGSKKLVNPTELDLFSLAWKRLQSNLRNAQPQMSFGRDTRGLALLDENLLAETEWNQEKQELLLKRIGKVDVDFRAPVVLKDILKFEDEEVLQILKIRWGVYRHRLHRGRLEMKEALKGKAAVPFNLLKPDTGTLTW